MARVQDKLRLQKITLRQGAGLAFAVLVIALFIYYNFAADAKYAGYAAALLQRVFGG